MFSQYVGSCVFPRPNVSGFHVPGEEKRGKLRNRKKRFPAVKKEFREESREERNGKLSYFMSASNIAYLYFVTFVIFLHGAAFKVWNGWQ
eukprot:PDM60540.1 hypothetical protein PRIPAC_53518 [Pristionchus pacificus]